MSSSSPSPESRPITVAIVEDDRGVREILRDWVNQEDGFSCSHTFDTAEAAVRELASASREAAPPPAVALVDINLPGISGIECVRRLKPLLAQTQFVMLTVYEDSSHIFDALAAGASGYLQKRTPRPALMNALKEVHAGGSPMTSNIARLVVESFQRSTARDGSAEGLSRRESEVLALIARGHLYKEVAEMMGLSLHTVKTYIRRICEKLHVHSRAQAVARYASLPERPAE
jgi:DNA-binding NarL/FixJ family response regulator